MFITPVSAHVACVIVACGGACITCNFCVVLCANIVDFQQIFTNSTGIAEPFHPGGAIRACGICALRAPFKMNVTVIK